jgi:hypothetical protein
MGFASADSKVRIMSAGSSVINQFRFTTARLARDRLAAFMQKQVAERKAEVAAGNTRADAFTMLVKANQDESSKYQLDDQELVRSPCTSLNMNVNKLVDRERICAIVCGPRYINLSGDQLNLIHYHRDYRTHIGWDTGFHGNPR